MNEDELATFEALTACRAVMTDLIASHNGRIANTAGDSVLAEFSNGIGAIQCAVAIQEALAARAKSASERSSLRLRIGVHLGEVMVLGGDLYGDDVNIAARLESLCAPGGVCLSERIVQHAGGAAAIGSEDLGLRSVKNFDRPLRVYAVSHLPVAPDASSDFDRAHSIAVLPFRPVGSADDQWLADGITDDLRVDLGQIPGTQIIARGSLASYSGDGQSAQEIGRQLGARYLVQGTIQRSSAAIRANVSLVDALNGEQAWADRFQESSADIQILQDAIVSQIARALYLELPSLGARASAPNSLHRASVSELTMRGWASFHQPWSPQTLAEARILFQRALALEPNHPEALTGLGSTYTAEVMNRWTATPEEALERAEAAADLAIAARPQYAMAHIVKAGVLRERKRFSEAALSCQAAIKANRSLAPAYGVLAQLALYSGDPGQAIGVVSRAIRLSPRDTFLGLWLAIRGQAQLHTGEIDEAIASLEAAVLANRALFHARLFLAAAHEMAGNHAEARRQVDQCIAERAGLSAATLRSEEFSQDARYLRAQAPIYDALRRASLPE